MIKIFDGRNEFYQWDIDRKLTVSDLTVTELHFCNKTSDCSLVVAVKDGLADVPNILLQTDWPIHVYAYCGDCYTKEAATFKVRERTKPADYVYTETEILQYSKLAAELEELKNDIGGEIEKYLEEHPIEIDGYATEQYVDDAIADIPKEVVNITTIDEVYETVADLPPNKGHGTCLLVLAERAIYTYDADNKQWGLHALLRSHTFYCVLNGENSGIYRYTMTRPYLVLAEEAAVSKAKNYTDEQVGEVQASLDGYATEKYVDDAIANIDIPEVDLTGYATEEYVNAKIGDIDTALDELHAYAQTLTNGGSAE